MYTRCRPCQKAFWSSTRRRKARDCDLARCDSPHLHFRSVVRSKCASAATSELGSRPRRWSPLIAVHGRHWISARAARRNLVCNIAMSAAESEMTVSGHPTRAPPATPIWSELFLVYGDPFITGPTPSRPSPTFKVFRIMQ